MNRTFFWLLVVLLLGGRFFHFANEIDLPHDWRQCDTAYYIWDFFQNGIDLFHPAVCWMGAYEHVILEFPLPEALVSLLYQISGVSIPVARLFFWSCFVGAVFYLYRIVALIWAEKTAQWVVLVYLALPLSWYYSRAIHIDFSAVFAAHAMLFYYLRAVLNRRDLDLFWAVLAATLAFLIKVPYAFYLALPMFLFTLREGALGWILRRCWVWALPLGAFWFWQAHVYQVNNQAPDWDYLLHYRKFDDNASWYFGHWSRRLMLTPWKIILKRTLLEVAGLGSLLLLLLGIGKLVSQKRAYFFWAWSLGVFLYVLIFFNLNIIHNYYQIPLLVPVALLGAWGLEKLADIKTWYASIALVVMLILNIAYAERTYFEVPQQTIEIAQLIAQETNLEDLVVVTYDKMDCRNPRILARAHRRGWSVEEAGLEETVLQRLHQEEGARAWAYIGRELPIATKDWSLPTPQVFPLRDREESVFLFSLLD